MYSEIDGGILHHFWNFEDQNVRCVVTKTNVGLLLQKMIALKTELDDGM
jgi:hypothetical protein